MQQILTPSSGRFSSPSTGRWRARMYRRTSCVGIHRILRIDEPIMERTMRFTGCPNGHTGRRLNVDAEGAIIFGGIHQKSCAIESGK